MPVMSAWLHGKNYALFRYADTFCSFCKGSITNLCRWHEVLFWQSLADSKTRRSNRVLLL